LKHGPPRYILSLDREAAEWLIAKFREILDCAPPKPSTNN
jgi:hypothetical protein